tara:strand:- start:144 stop:737 length:594 start_codon:yes stop_codon:yes gene_type:complete
VNDFNYKNEILRKFIHLFDSVIPLSLFFISKELLLSILIPITIIFITLDLARHHISFLGNIYSTFFNIVTRDIEKKKNNFTGASYYLLGCSIVVFLFNNTNIIIASLLIMSISDSFAALVGVKFGKTKIYGNKSLEGSFAFYVSTIIILYFFINSLTGFEYMYISFLITLVELFSFYKINDNLTIPVFGAIILTYLT